MNQMARKIGKLNTPQTILATAVVTVFLAGPIQLLLWLVNRLATLTHSSTTEVIWVIGGLVSIILTTYHQEKMQ